MAVDRPCASVIEGILLRTPTPTTSAFAEPRQDKPAGVRRRTVIRIPKTAEVVAANIRKMIIRGEVSEGDFLQPEAQLMEHFGTSRPTIREAFRILENEQLISVTRGSRSGARVHAPTVDGVARYAGFALQAEGTLLSDIHLARLGIESFAVRLVAETHTDAQIAALRAELDQVFAVLDEHGPGAVFRMALLKLHHSIVATAGSNTLTLMSAMLQGIAEQHLSKYVVRGETDLNTEAQMKRTRAGVRSFGKLFDLLEARDTDAAEAHWRLHMKNANETWLQGYDQTTLVDVLD
jgi:DNA-binding FadR family transcriptional regulator